MNNGMKKKKVKNNHTNVTKQKGKSNKKGGSLWLNKVMRVKNEWNNKVRKKSKGENEWM